MSAAAGSLTGGADALEGLRARPRRAASSVRRLLSGEPGEVLTLRPAAPTGRRSADPGAGALEEALATWAGRIRRRRALVLLRRHLIAVLGLTIVVEILALAAGAERLGWWLLAPGAFGLASFAVALRRRLAPEQTAQLLDRRLGLHDLTATGLELTRSGASRTGLGALVAEEARAAALRSLTTVRLRPLEGRREWALLGTLAALLAGLLLIAHSSTSATTVRRHALASGPAATALARHEAAAAAARKAALAHALGSPLPSQAPPPLAVQTGGSKAGTQTAFSPYGHGGASLSAKQLASQGIASPPSSKASLGALSVGAGAGASSQPSSSASTGGASGSSAAGRGSSKHGSGTSAGTGAGLSPATSRTGASLGAGATRESGAGAGGSGSSPPGGGAAGTARGSTTLTAGFVPALGTSGSGLPLQAGYAPSGSRSSSGQEGVSQTPNGGGGTGRSKHSSSGGETSADGGLAVIPPSLNAPSPVEAGVLSSYFGSANQLTAGSW